MIWLIILAVITGLLFLPLGFRAVYAEHNSGVWVFVGPVKFRVYPKKKRKEAPKQKACEKPHKDSQKGGNYQNFKLVVSRVVEFLNQFRRKIRINHLELKIALTGDDPSDLAVRYGETWAAIGNLLPQLERVFTIKHRDLDVIYDFAADKTRVYARVDASITLGRTLHLLSKHGMKTIIHLIKLKQLRKGGAQ